MLVEIIHVIFNRVQFNSNRSDAVIFLVGIILMSVRPLLHLFTVRDLIIAIQKTLMPDGHKFCRSVFLNFRNHTTHFSICIHAHKIDLAALFPASLISGCRVKSRCPVFVAAFVFEAQQGFANFLGGGVDLGGELEFGYSGRLWIEDTIKFYEKSACHF